MYSTENCAARRPITGSTGRRLCGISDEEDTLQPSALATCRATILLHLGVAEDAEGPKMAQSRC